MNVFIAFGSSPSRQFHAALSDLREAIKLCPNNQEIKRLLARVEEECKQLQRTQQQKQQPCPQPLQQSNDSDNEGEALAQDHFSLEEMGEGESLHEEEPGLSVPRLPLSQTAVPGNRNPLEGHHQKFRPISPPNKTGSKYLREPGLTVQPTKQAQIVKTNQHLNSIQSGARTGLGQSSKKIQPLQYLPPSPVPSRPLSNLSNNKNQHLDGTNTLSASITVGNSSALCNERPVANQFPYLQHSDKGSHPFMSKSKTQDRLAVPAPSNMEKPVLPPCQGISELRQQNALSPNPASVHMVLSSSTSSLCSSSSFAEGIKGQGQDIRLKESRANQLQIGTTEHRPRNTPFMGITDKTARFQQQTNPSNRSWHGQTAEGFLSTTATGGGLLSSSCEQFYAKQSSSYGNHTASFAASAVLPGDSLQNGSQPKELEDLVYSQDSRLAKPMAHLYQDVLSKQHSQMNKDIHSSHVTSTKPKQSFVESNV